MKSRIDWDNSDNRVKVYEMLKSFSSFPDNPALRNIVNGVTADKKFNVAKFIQFGQEIISKITGHAVFTCECSQKSQAHSITTKITVKNKSIKYYPRPLYQQLLLAFPWNLVDLNGFLSFELAAFLLSLVTAVNFLQKSNEQILLLKRLLKYPKKNRVGIMNQKTKLKINQSKAFGRDEPISAIPMDTQDNQYVADEGSLLGHIIRPKK